MPAAIRDPEKAQMVRLYQTGLDIHEVANSIGRERRAVGRILRESGIPMRSASELRRRYAVDESAFDATSPGASYFTGFLLADGDISGKRTVRLRLGEEDSGHVETFRQFLGSTHPITFDTGRGFSRAGSRTAGVAIASERLCDALASRGVTRTKTRTANVRPQFADDADFWRGMIDGDGWLTYRRQRHGWHITVGLTGTLAVCESFAAFATRRLGPPQRLVVDTIYRNHSIWKVQVNGLRALRLADLLYTDACVALPRKKAIADAFAALASNL